MPLDPIKLLSFAIPHVRQEISPRDIAFYALSVGLGHDAVDPRQFAYIDPSPKIRVLPTMALVLAHPGFWLGDPESGVDPTSVLHADQQLQILAPLPATGAVVSRSRVTELIDKGPGKAALLRTETIISAAGGLDLARLTRTTFLRKSGGFGGTDKAAEPPVAMPDRAPDHLVDLATWSEQALFYRLNGDLNPLHADPAIAKAAGFDRPILHGLCVMGMACHALLRALAEYDERRLTMIRLRFAGVVYPGETLRFSIWSDGSFTARVAERDVVVIDQGQATVGNGDG